MSIKECLWQRKKIPYGLRVTIQQHVCRHWSLWPVLKRVPGYQSSGWFSANENVTNNVPHEKKKKKKARKTGSHNDLVHKPKHSNRVIERLVDCVHTKKKKRREEKKLSKCNHTRSLMTRDISCDQTRQKLRLVWTLESESSYRAFHHSTRYVINLWDGSNRAQGLDLSEN